MKRCHNAARVLPPDLFEAVRRHVAGCYLWVPSLTRKQRSQRDAKIMYLYREKGLTTKEIAKRFYIKPRRVRQILEKARVAEKQAAAIKCGNKY